VTFVANDLICVRSTRTVLSGVSLTLRPGEVLGSNGAGKTSLLATLAGNCAPAAAA